MIRLSIIVPIYNAKKYLRQCFDSIANQSFRDIEILLIDDGSTDGSARICEICQEADERVRVFHQKNSGCVAARRLGVQNSKGTYIGFVDSDDWIAQDMYQILMDAALEKDCDIVSLCYSIACDEMKKEEEDGVFFGLYEKGKNMDALLSGMMYMEAEKRRGVSPSLCSKVFRREFLLEAFDQMDENITMGEDAAVFYPCCLKAERILILKEYKYFYRIHDTSMCRSMDLHTVLSLHSFYKYMDNALAGYDEKYNLREQLIKYFWSFVTLWLGQVWELRIESFYVFPYAVVEKKAEVVLYGAGKVGQSFYQQIQGNKYCHIVAWADKRYSGDSNIIAPEKLCEFEYDVIVIAVKREDMADEIREELTSQGIDQKKILWVSPQEIPPLLL